MSRLTTIHKGARIITAKNDVVSFIPGEYNDLPNEWLDLLEAQGALTDPKAEAVVAPKSDAGIISDSILDVVEDITPPSHNAIDDPFEDEE